jgi:hypothetical protein
LLSGGQFCSGHFSFFLLYVDIWSVLKSRTILIIINNRFWLAYIGIVR